MGDREKLSLLDAPHPYGACNFALFFVILLNVCRDCQTNIHQYPQQISIANVRSFFFLFINAKKNFAARKRRSGNTDTVGGNGASLQRRGLESLRSLANVRREDKADQGAVWSNALGIFLNADANLGCNDWASSWSDTGVYVRTQLSLPKYRSHLGFRPAWLLYCLAPSILLSSPPRAVYKHQCTTHMASLVCQPNVRHSGRYIYIYIYTYIQNANAYLSITRITYCNYIMCTYCTSTESIPAGICTSSYYSLQSTTLT